MARVSMPDHVLHASCFVLRASLEITRTFEGSSSFIPKKLEPARPMTTLHDGIKADNRERGRSEGELQRNKKADC